MRKESRRFVFVAATSLSPPRRCRRRRHVLQAGKGRNRKEGKREKGEVGKWEKREMGEASAAGESPLSRRWVAVELSLRRLKTSKIQKQV